MNYSERVSRMMKSYKTAMALALVLVAAQVVTASPPTWFYQSGPVTSHIQSGLRIVDVTVNAYVWNLADYQAANPTFELTDGLFAYEYVVQNLSTSTVSISTFQVPIASPASINDITTVGTVGGVGATSVILDASTLPSATWFFDLRPSLSRNMTSCKLVYTSDNGIDVGSATVGGSGGISGDLVMPTPIPEPVTAVMLAAGGLALIRKRSHKTVTR
jgi:hypothetical protein